jgi:dienelactone hydrolase
MLYEAICREARAISSQSLHQPLSPDHWAANLETRRQQWLEMLGLWPLPERTPLQATVTGVLERGDYVVEKIHFQCLPGCHVAGNLYRPAQITEPLPAVLYLCGHTKGKVNLPYQQQPRWLGQHGYVALVLDPIQLGECQGLHHGTYHAGRWDWYSRGYTPAGTEVWNAMRALDYLQSREDVCLDRLGVTGLSGGGAMSWFLGAADERVKAVVPVCQTGTIEHICTDRATDGHCDCAFWINTHRWCTPDLGALIAPRALLVASGTEDVLWRPYAFRDALLRIQHQYAALGAGENCALIEDLTPHGYSPRLRQAIFTWLNTHLKDDPAPVTDDVTDFLEPEENLLVFGGQLPAEDRMGEVDRLLPPRAAVPELDSALQARQWQSEQMTRLCSRALRHLPELPQPRLLDVRHDGATYLGADKQQREVYGSLVWQTHDGLRLAVRTATPSTAGPRPATVVYALPAEAVSGFMGASRSRPAVPPGVATAGVEVRHTAASSVGPGYLWTLRRTYPLLGHTLPERQISDLLEALALLRQQQPTGPVALYGEGPTAVLALYAALVDEQVSEVILKDLPATHEDPATPELLGVLQVGDLPQNLALLCPRRITFVGEPPEGYRWTVGFYAALGQREEIRCLEKMADWTPGE